MQRRTTHEQPRGDHPRCSPVDPGHPRVAPERGAAMIVALVFAVIVSGMVVSGTLLMRAHREQADSDFRMNAQTVQFGRAGLIEALGWFRKSPVQPVTAFEPINDPTANPPVLETLEPEIGIVREFQISGPIWGRYEIWKQWEADPDPVRLAWRRKVQVEDITAEAGASGTGNIWRLRAVSYVFQQMDPNVRFDQRPNVVLGTEVLETEIRRMSLAPPGQAALCVREARNASVISKVNLRGNVGAGIFHTRRTGWVSRSGGPNIQGAPAISSSRRYDDSLEAVFGVPADELRVLADVRVTQAASFPSPVNINSLYYVDVPRLDFTQARPLVGTAVIYVKGDVDFARDNRSFFSGLLYVDGNLTMRETLDFSGTIIVTGTVRIEGRSDWVDISLDDEALNSLRTAIGQYRMSGAIRSVHAVE